MKTYAITAEGVSLIYFPAELDFPPDIANALLRVGDEVGQLIRQGSNSRVIVFNKNPPFYPAYAKILFWESPQIALTELDKLISENDVRDEYFAQSIITEYITVLCQGCRIRYGALAIDGGDIYPGKKGLFLKKHLRQQFKCCPHCSTSLGSVVKLLFEEPKDYPQQPLKIY